MPFKLPALPDSARCDTEKHRKKEYKKQGDACEKARIDPGFFWIKGELIRNRRPPSPTVKEKSWYKYKLISELHGHRFMIFALQP